MTVESQLGVGPGHARPGDTVARLGGDEFGVLLEDITAAEAVRSAELLLQGLAAPIVLRDRDLTPTASIGIAIANGEDAETLLRNADTAMYAAKRQGKGRYALFEPAMHATIIERLDLAADLGRAMQQGQLSLCYQPEIQLRSGRIIGLEAAVTAAQPCANAACALSNVRASSESMGFASAMLTSAAPCSGACWPAARCGRAAS